MLSVAETKFANKLEAEGLKFDQNCNDLLIYLVG